MYDGRTSIVSLCMVGGRVLLVYAWWEDEYCYLMHGGRTSFVSLCMVGGRVLLVYAWWEDEYC